MSGPDTNQNPRPTGNPGDDYPPTRPGAVVIVVALALIVAGLSIENWTDLSSLAHFTQIEKALGL
jgi:hypothetical protein